MATTVLTQKQLEDLFQSLTSGFLGTTDPSAVRIQWPTGGAPSWSITDDVCFLQIVPKDDNYSRLIQTEFSEYDSTTATTAQVYTAGVRVAWDFYGPSAMDNAGLVRASLFLNSTTTTLIASNIALVTEVPMPVRTPENFNGEWWNRANFYANFNELVRRESTVPYITSSDVQVKEG